MYQKRKVNVYSLNAKLHSFRVLPPRTFAGKMLQIAVVQFSKRPGVRIRKSKKTQQKVRKRISAKFFKEMVPIQVKKLHKKIFVPEIPWDIVAKNTF